MTCHDMLLILNASCRASFDDASPEDVAFDDFDLNGDGYITREEFDQAGTNKRDAATRKIFVRSKLCVHGPQS